MAAILAIVSKYVLPAVLGVAILLGVVAKFAWDGKQEAEQDLVEAVQRVERVRSELAQERRSIEALTQALSEAKERREALARANEELSREVSHAIQDNQAWGDTRTPAAVTDSLCRTLSCD